MPILGICRGEQILNVALGGTLIIDIPEYKLQAAGNRPQASGTGQPVVLHQTENYMQCFHPVKILKNSLLFSIVMCDSGTVTSNHHQSVEMPAPGLRIDASAPDSITEGIEWKNPSGRSFLLGVQWHPERMDTSNALSGRLLRNFILQSRIFKENSSKQY